MSEESPFLQVIRVWAGLAWADGVIADAEARALRKLIESAGLEGEEKATALGYLEQEVGLEAEGLSELSENARLGVYKAAVRLAGVDEHFAPEERSFLVRLRDGLALTADVAERIEADVGRPE